MVLYQHSKPMWKTQGMKKTLICIIMLLAGIAAASADEVKEYFSAGNPIKFCDTAYYLQWSTDIDNYYFIQEYLPQGQTFDDYTKMFTVSVMFTGNTAEDILESKLAWVAERQRTDMVCNYRMFKQDDEYMLDFITSEGNDEGLTQVERNIVRYYPMKINGQSAVIQCYYTSRAYGDDILPFIKAISDNSTDLYNAMILMKITPRFVR